MENSIHITYNTNTENFKLTEQQKCFHYTNLQPLWATENLIKNDKVIIVP